MARRCTSTWRMTYQFPNGNLGIDNIARGAYCEEALGQAS